MELLAVVLWLVLEVFRCNGVARFGVVIDVGGVKMKWGCWLWCCDWC